MNNTRHKDGKLNVVGEQIKNYRKKYGYTYQNLSDKLMLLGVDIHKQAIYNIEKGIRTVVDYELCAFAKCFKITTDKLLEDYKNTLD